jgi:Tfp pilus assembly protein PilX
MMMHKSNISSERGFVLATSLMLLTLLTLFSVAMYFVGRSAIQTSASAQNSTEAYYYAETALNYVAWALRNDAEFDSYKYSGGVSLFLPEPATPAGSDTLGDWSELGGYRWDPGPTAISDSSAAGTSGQVMYFDNSPMANRFVCLQSAATFSNCIDITLAPSARVEPVMFHISASLPRYIKLEIASTGVITPSIPSLPHPSTPVVGTDIPTNGAVVWITAGDINDANKDIEIFPLDPASAYTGILPSECDGGVSNSCPCNATAANYGTAQACDATDPTNPVWVDGYSIVAYAIGYADGKPMHMIRVVIM